MQDLISAFLNPLIQDLEYEIPPEPDMEHFRRLHIVPPPPHDSLEMPSLEAAREIMRKEISKYLSIEHPEHILLLQPSPGVGKTTAAVEFAVDLAKTGKRVMYCGPRHNFWDDVLEATAKYDAASMPFWYEWLPRRPADEDGNGETCRYTSEITAWMEKGYNAMDFCKGICGWKYLGEECPYHAQKKSKNPIVFCQHAHATLGHPLKFDVVFGDENPLGAFLYRRQITQKNIVPPGMSHGKLKTMLTTLSYLVTSEKALFGYDLITALGGPDAVLEACAEYQAPDLALIFIPEIHDPKDAENAPSFYLHEFTSLLKREAMQIKNDVKNYPKRIFAMKNRLYLLLRRTVSESLPEHVIWLDGTGNSRIYEELFGRPVKVVDARPKIKGKIYQIWDRANGKSTLVPPKEGAEEFKGRRTVEDIKRYQDQTFTLIDTIIRKHQYKNPVVITYKDLKAEAEVRVINAVKVGHFGGERGSNKFVDCDVVFVVGTPMPNLYDLESMAAQIFFNRDDPFDPRFYAVERHYMYQDASGMGRAYPVSGYWSDLDLHSVLESLRDDEIIQAAHRVRPVNKSSDVWLFTNLPIRALPPDELFSVRDILDAPDGVDSFKWQKLLQMLDITVKNGESITMQDISDLIDVSRTTAAKYMDKLEKTPGWERAVMKRGSKGRPERGIVKDA